MKYLIMSLAFFAVLGQIYTVTLDELENRVNFLEEGARKGAKGAICGFINAAKALKKGINAYGEMIDDSLPENAAFKALDDSMGDLKSFGESVRNFCECGDGPGNPERREEVNEMKRILENFLEVEGKGRRGKRPTTVSP